MADDRAEGADAGAGGGDPGRGEEARLADYIIQANPRRTRLAIKTEATRIEIAADGLPGSTTIVGEIVFGDGMPVPIGRIVLRNNGKAGHRAIVRIEEAVSARRVRPRR